jgi:plasmid stability protein
MVRKLVSYRLADDLQQALKARASSEGISATELVNRLLRQGLGAEAEDAALPQRVSHLEQIVHQLEQRLATQGTNQGLSGGAIAPLPEALVRRLIALEQKIDALTATGESSGPRPKPSFQPVRRDQCQDVLEAPGPAMSTLDPLAYGGEQSQDVVQMPLAALRKLLSLAPPD